MSDKGLTDQERIELAEKGAGVREITEEPKPRQKPAETKKSEQ